MVAALRGAAIHEIAPANADTLIVNIPLFQ
jgi:hypothetical protein